MSTLVWSIVAFLSGALPFSVWIGRLVLHKDIRQYGDGNPGMTNVFRAGGRVSGMAAMLLDGFKGTLPVGLARWGYGLDGWEEAAVAIAPVLGHAFSPFLKFRGGKAVAVTFGIWTGLTLPFGPLLLGITLALTLAITASEGWPIFPAMLALLGGLWLIQAPGWMFGVWSVNLLVFFWKHSLELRQPPRLRPWLRRAFHLLP